MICPECDGSGRVTVYNALELVAVEPCEECGGSGVVHCCEGLREQPTAAPAAPPSAPAPPTEPA